MEISSTTPSAFGATSATAEAATAEISSDFNTFLRMLTVQMQNQDPLNPIESSDYAVQLATFSGVEQQVRTNDLLRSLAGQMGATGMTQLAGWVGKEARAVAPALLSGQPISILPSVAESADAAQMIVRDVSGSEVQRFDIPLSNEPVTWAGVTTDGYPYPPGLYSFHVTSYEGDATLETRQAAVYSTVTEVRTENGEAKLILQGGTAVSASDVTALRDPSLLN